MNEWIVDENKTLTKQKVYQIAAMLENEIVIIEHWFYCGGRSPERLVFDDKDDFIEYIKNKTKAGDSVWFWSYSKLCKDDNAIVNGKLPDPDGRIPKGGAY